jgi:lysozyme
MLAVDFNHWKTVSSWSALAAAVDAVILKATQYTTYVDPTFAGSLGLARKTGKCVGVYHFVGRNGMQAAHLPPGDPLAEADWFLSKYAHQPGEMVIVDYEPDAEPVDPDAWLAAHCARIIARTGVVPVVYMNFSTAAKRSWAKTRALGCALWIARYYANNGQISGADPDAGPWGSFIGWQYTSNGSLPGISAQVDLSRFDLTPAQWRGHGHPGRSDRRPGRLRIPGEGLGRPGPRGSGGHHPDQRGICHAGNPGR